MRSRSRRWLLACAVAASLIPALPAVAAATSTSGVALVREGDVVEDDFYAGALTVLVLGTVEGDLIAAAADRIVIEGEVTGSVTALAAEVVVSGRVAGSLRVASGSLTISGEVGGDVVGTSFDLELTSDAVVSGEVLVWARHMSAAGEVGESVRGSMGTLVLAGEVGASVDVSVGRLRIIDRLVVGRDLAYRSEREAEGLDLAEVEGTIVKRAELPPNIRVRALLLLARLLAIVFVSITAVAVVWGWPDATRRSSTLAASLRSWLTGAGVFASPVLVVLVAAMVLRLAPAEAGLPFLVVLIPLFLGLVGLLMLAALVAAVPVSTRLGAAMFRGLGVQGATLAGSLVLGLFWLIPRVGVAVPLLALPLGLGAWLRLGSVQSVGDSD